MKRFFVYLAVLTAMVFMVSCGGGSSEKNYEKDNGGICSQNEEGTYKCMGGASYMCSCAEWDNVTDDCKKYLWHYPITCNAGCNEWSGVCECSKEEADAKNHECMGDYQLKCSRDGSYEVAEYFWHIDLFCINGCDTSTGKCNPCRYNTFTCYFEKEWDVDYSYKCEDGHFESDELCLNGCDKSTGKCNPCEEGSFICKEWDVDFSYKCEDGHFESDELCVNGCNKSTGQCNFCEYGTFTCYEGDSYKCTEGLFKRYGVCDESGCDSSSGKCRCTDFVEGYKTCDDWEKLHTCVNGIWEIEECRYGCNSETLSCKGEDGCSVQGAFRCNGDILQKCDQEWKNYENCAYSNKICTAETGRCEYE